MTLASLIDLAETEGLLTNTEKKLASVIQDYRNLIHPGRQIRKSNQYDFETATIANSLVNIILKAISNKQQATTLFTAQEIIDKLKIDWNFKSTVYEKVILKLKEAEKNKLFDLLCHYEAEEKGKWDAFKQGDIAIHYATHELFGIKDLVIQLKPLLQSEFIIQKLHELVKQIQKGSQLNAFVLFNFLHEEIDKLQIEEQEMITYYFLSAFMNYLDNCSDLSNDKTYSTIGKYIRTEEGIKEFNNFTLQCMVNFDPKRIYSQMNAYEQAFNSLQDSQKEIVCKEINEHLSAAWEHLGLFGKAAIERGIILKPSFEPSTL